MNQLIVFLFFAIFLLSCLALFIFKIWRNLNTSIHQFFEQFKLFEHQVTDTVQNIPGAVVESIEKLRNGEDPLEFEEEAGMVDVYKDPFLTKPAQVGPDAADVGLDPFLTAFEADRRHCDAESAAEKRGQNAALLHFAEVLLEKFRSVEDAFAAFDEDKDGRITLGEFKQSVKRLRRFQGDAAVVFRALGRMRLVGRPSPSVFLTQEDFQSLRRLQLEQEAAKTALEEATSALRASLGIGLEAQETIPAPSTRYALVRGMRACAERALLLSLPEATLRDAKHALEEWEATTELEQALQEHQEGQNNKTPNDWHRLYSVGQKMMLRPRLLRDAQKVVEGLPDYDRSSFHDDEDADLHGCC